MRSSRAWSFFSAGRQLLKNQDILQTAVKTAVIRGTRSESVERFRTLATLYICLRFGLPWQFCCFATVPPLKQCALIALAQSMGADSMMTRLSAHMWRAWQRMSRLQLQEPAFSYWAECYRIRGSICSLVELWTPSLRIWQGPNRVVLACTNREACASAPRSFGRGCGRGPCHWRSNSPS